MHACLGVLVSCLRSKALLTNPRTFLCDLELKLNVKHAHLLSRTRWDLLLRLQAKRLLKEMQAQSAAAEATRQLEVVMAKRPAGAGTVKAALSKAEAAASNLSSLGGASLAEALIPRIQVCTGLAGGAMCRLPWGQGIMYTASWQKRCLWCGGGWHDPVQQRSTLCGSAASQHVPSQVPVLHQAADCDDMTPVFPLSDAGCPQAARGREGGRGSIQGQPELQGSQ
jgi:hypothetical protein